MANCPARSRRRFSPFDATAAVLMLAVWSGDVTAQVPGRTIEVDPLSVLAEDRGTPSLPPGPLSGPERFGPFAGPATVRPDGPLSTLDSAFPPPGRTTANPLGLRSGGRLADGRCGPEACEPFDDPFTYVTRRGRAWSALPRTLLWEPPLAGLREPRFLGLPNGLSNAFTDETVDFAIGNTLGMLRVQSADARWAVQADIFAVVIARFANYDYYVASDYRAGVPVTFAYGPWHAKIGYEHTSAHLGDETLLRLNRLPINYIREEVVFGLGRYFCDQQLRLYGQFGWAFYQRIPGDPPRARFDIGGEWVRRRATGWSGQPFAAANLEFNGANDYDPSLSLQAGWMWRDPTRRLAQARLFGQYYTGFSPFGQFFQTRENWLGFGLAVDY